MSTGTVLADESVRREASKDPGPSNDQPTEAKASRNSKLRSKRSRPSRRDAAKSEPASQTQNSQDGAQDANISGFVAKENLMPSPVTVTESSPIKEHPS